MGLSLDTLEAVAKGFACDNATCCIGDELPVKIVARPRCKSRKKRKPRFTKVAKVTTRFGGNAFSGRDFLCILECA